MKSFLLIILSFYISSSASAQYTIDYNTLSENLLQAVIDNEDTQKLQDLLSQTTVEKLAEGLDSDAKRLAFWVNIYNSYIQIILREQPELYENRGAFFKLKQLPIAGLQLSFADVEHGIIRHSSLEYFLGYITNPFPPDYQEKLRVENKDWRIHFALNCGAKDCPPVAVYTADNLDYEFDYMSKRYLNNYSEVDSSKKEVHTAQLFAWFRGDFGGSSGIRDILVNYDVIPESPRYTMQQKKYDWTLKLDNFIAIPPIK